MAHPTPLSPKLDFIVGDKVSNVLRTGGLQRNCVDLICNYYFERKNFEHSVSKKCSLQGSLVHTYIYVGG